MSVFIFYAIKDKAMQSESRVIPPPPPRVVEPRRVYKSCCFEVDKRLLEFLVQVIIATGLLCFCGVKLSTTTTCEEASSYWNLLGVLIGWVFKSMIHRS